MIGALGVCLALRARMEVDMRGSHIGILAAMIAGAACGDTGSGGYEAASNMTSAPASSRAGGGGSAAGHDNNGGGSAQGAGGPHVPCDVDAILGRSCRSCHGASPTYGAPMPLVTYADLTAPWKGGKVYERVKERVHANTSPMPPAPTPRLTAAELATVDAWVAAGAQASSDSCTRDPGSPPPAKQLSCTPDTFVRPTSGFTMPTGKTDVYACYGFDLTSGQKKHAIGFAPHVDNTKIVHHLLLFQADSSYGTDPKECDMSSAAAWHVVTGWAPGGEPTETPPEAGFPQQGTTHYVMQLHYNNASGKNAGEVDKSGFDICTTTQLRPNDAAVMAFGSVSFNLPPRATSDLACDYTPHFLSSKVHIFGARPHMHGLGKAMTTHITHDAVDQKVVDQQAFDFNAQIGFHANADLQNGDTVTTHCIYNNTTDQTVTFGEATGNEMCFDFVAYYPAVMSPLWAWVTPSVMASCRTQ